MSSVIQFYDGKSVFITGGTGFVGKVLIQRLLVCCPNIEKIYVLIRSTKKGSPQERLNAMLGGTVFESVSTKNLFQKIIPISGDVVGPDLGIRHEDLETLFEHVSIVFHSAATVKFDEALKTAVEVNVCGTKKLLALCRHMKRLEAFIHVSTAYSNCHRKKIEEQIYDPVIPPDQLIHALEWMDNDMVQSITPTIIPPWPNTYTFCKALAESVIQQDNPPFPVAIVRPSIIGAAVRHPYPGFIDNYNGPSGLLAAIGKGALRTMLGNKDAVADIVPVDSVVDLLIVVPWHLTKQSIKHVPVYNFVSGPENPLTWGYVQDSTVACYMKNPIEHLYRIPSAQFTPNRFVNKFWTLLDHLLPAHLVDLVSMAQHKKPSVVRSYEKLHKALLCLDYFTQRSWDFDTENVTTLWKAFPEADRTVFNFDISAIDWKAYMEQFCLGVKVFLLHEKLENLPQARKNLARRKNLSRAAVGVMCMLLLTVVSRYTRMFRQSWVVTLSITVRLLMLLWKLFQHK